MYLVRKDREIDEIINRNIKALAKNPGNIEITCDTAELLFQTNQLDPAIKVVTDCLSFNEKDPWLRFRLASFYFKKGMRIEVIEIIDQLDYEQIDTPALRKLRSDLEYMNGEYTY